MSDQITIIIKDICIIKDALDLLPESTDVSRLKYKLESIPVPLRISSPTVDDDHIIMSRDELNKNYIPVQTVNAILQQAPKEAEQIRHDTAAEVMGKILSAASKPTGISGFDWRDIGREYGVDVMPMLAHVN